MTRDYVDPDRAGPTGNQKLDALLREALERYNSMSEEEQADMWRRQREAAKRPRGDRIAPPSELELQILEEIVGVRPPRPWGAAVGAAYGGLVELGYVTGGIWCPAATDEGRAALHGRPAISPVAGFVPAPVPLHQRADVSETMVSYLAERVGGEERRTRWWRRFCWVLLFWVLSQDVVLFFVAKKFF